MIALPTAQYTGWFWQVAHPPKVIIKAAVAIKVFISFTPLSSYVSISYPFIFYKSVNMSTVLDPRLVSCVKSAEGCKLTAYKDTLGYWTVGWGHLLSGSQSWAGYTTTQAQADAWLDSDLQAAYNAAARLPEAKDLDQVRLNALAELAFNLGAKWKMFAKTRAAISDKRWKDAHDGLLCSLWASQVGKARSERLADMLLTGEYT